MTALIPSLLFAAASIVIGERSVSFTAVATDVKPGTMLEFLVVGPDSDRTYEAAFVSDARIVEIAMAFDKAGIPRGKPVDAGKCRFWPAGAFITLEPDFSKYVDDVRKNEKVPVVFTGGSRDAVGMPVADTNMPSSVFAFYSLGQSLMLFDDAQDQSLAYGRFLSNDKLKKGERVTFTVRWNGRDATVSRSLELESGRLGEAISALKDAKGELDVTPIFSRGMTVREAIAASEALGVLDSRKIKINGSAVGQFFYRGFLPDLTWLDRNKRLTQPVEVRIDGTNETFTVIDEDWKVEGDDPKLTPRTVKLADLSKSFNGDTCFFYVSPAMKLDRIYSLMPKLPKGIRNWYVYTD